MVECWSESEKISPSATSPTINFVLIHPRLNSWRFGEETVSKHLSQYSGIVHLYFDLLAYWFSLVSSWAYSSTPRMEGAYSSETSMNFYQIILLHIPGACSLRSHRCENLNSDICTDSYLFQINYPARHEDVWELLTWVIDGGVWSASSPHRFTPGVPLG